MKEALIFISGVAVTFILLKYLSKKGSTGVKDSKGNKTNSTEELKKLLTTNESLTLAKTEEFKNLTQTIEFKNFIKTLAEEQIYAIAKSLTK